VPKGPGKHGGFSGFVLLAGGRADGDRPGAGGLGSLAEHLREARVEALVVVGIAADVCVSATAQDARRLGYRVSVPLSATAFVHAHPGGDEGAIADLRAAGITVT
jgi:nicotinamidase/pyrazinamidase